MNDFERKKLELMTPLLVEAGAALMEAQGFEYGIALFLFHMSRIGTEGLDPQKMEKIMDDVEKQTAGQLFNLLKKHISLSHP